jgi:hypothetical protein
MNEAGDVAARLSLEPRASRPYPLDPQLLEWQA